MLTNIKLSIKRTASILLASCCLVSCNYLDVIPPATPDFDDTMKDVMHFLRNVFSGGRLLLLLKREYLVVIPITTFGRLLITF